KLALRFARSESAMRDIEARSSNAPESRAQRIARAAESAAKHADECRRQIREIDAKYDTASPNQRATLSSRRYELTAELNLANTQRDVLEEYAMFAVSAESGDSAALSQKIDELERSVPELQMSASRAPTTAPSGAQAAFDPSSVGI